MDKNIAKLKPVQVWNHFYALTQIPRPSKKEKGVAEYIVAFAKKNKIDYSTDKAGNVILRKPATKGMENRKGIILQAHMDMVPQKNADRKFDFEKDPIEAYVDGKWVTANGTTLGADNGMGLAAALAVFENNTLKHGPIEALFTIDEEAGMTGAFALKAGELKGDILMNLDSEDEGQLYVGCAGGLDANIKLPYKEEATPQGVKAYELSVKGLRGGHSGLEIILQRGNSNKLLNRFMKYASEKFGMRLSHIDGGGLRNAIPRESFALVVVPEAKAAAFAKSVKEYEKIYKTELAEVENELSFTAAGADVPAKVMDASSQGRLIDALYACPNGVYRMSDSIKGLVETSNNMARVISQKGNVEVTCLMRSSVNSAKDDIGQMIASVFSLAGAKVELAGGYDGWNPDMESPILGAMTETYRQLYGKKPKVKAIHAGLECGIIGAKYPKLDMISFGPTIKYPHSPDEKVEIASVGKFWDFLTKALENAPKK